MIFFFFPLHAIMSIFYLIFRRLLTLACEPDYKIMSKIPPVSQSLPTPNNGISGAVDGSKGDVALVQLQRTSPRHGREPERLGATEPQGHHDKSLPLSCPLQASIPLSWADLIWVGPGPPLPAPGAAAA